MELKINQDHCLGCGACIIVCPINKKINPEITSGNGPTSTDVIMIVENGVIKLFHPEKCDKCNICHETCPTNAIYLTK
ncbi:MAG: 4Fe-4S binding protein [Methanobacteriaceae archaeon]|nr:4Fe-4S binding protein [Methanobacteriaceae archaeon]